MADPSNKQVTPWISLLVVGISLNTIGIVLHDAGVLRYILMGAGILLMLVCVLKMASQSSGKPPSGP